MKSYYIASCVFTAQFPERSLRIREYIEDRWKYDCVRCCVPKYKIRQFEEKMPEGVLREGMERKDCSCLTQMMNKKRSWQSIAAIIPRISWYVIATIVWKG